MAFNLGQFIGETVTGAGQYAQRRNQIEKQKTDELMRMLQMAGQLSDQGASDEVFNMLGLDEQQLAGFRGRSQQTRERQELSDRGKLLDVENKEVKNAWDIDADKRLKIQQNKQKRTRINTLRKTVDSPPTFDAFNTAVEQLKELGYTVSPEKINRKTKEFKRKGEVKYQQQEKTLNPPEKVISQPGHMAGSTQLKRDDYGTYEEDLITGERWYETLNDEAMLDASRQLNPVKRQETSERNAIFKNVADVARRDKGIPISLLQAWARDLVNNNEFTEESFNQIINEYLYNKF